MDVGATIASLRHSAVVLAAPQGLPPVAQAAVLKALSHLVQVSASSVAHPTLAEPPRSSRLRFRAA